MDEKICRFCGGVFKRAKRRSFRSWEKAVTCSHKCGSSINRSLTHKRFNKYRIENGVLYIKYKSLEILCDAEDFDKIRGYRWNVGSTYPSNGFKRLHNIVMGNTPKGMFIDHINRNKLDNRKSNLRFVSPEENSRNIDIRNKYGYHSIFKRCNRYVSSIRVNGKKIHLGTYDSIEEAINARKEAEYKYWN